jgi:cell division protein FtsW (lipid II flippase)
MPVKEFRKRAAVVGLGGLWIAGAPWWAVFLLGVMGFVVACLQTVLPQESAHRLAWWRDRRKARERL